MEDAAVTSTEDEGRDHGNGGQTCEDLERRSNGGLDAEEERGSEEPDGRGTLGATRHTAFSCHQREEQRQHGRRLGEHGALDEENGRDRAEGGGDEGGGKGSQHSVDETVEQQRARHAEDPLEHQHMGFREVVEGPHAPNPPDDRGVHGIGGVALLRHDDVIPRIGEVGSPGTQVVEDQPEHTGVEREEGVRGEGARNRGEAESRCSRESHVHTLPFPTRRTLRNCWCSVVGRTLEIPSLNLTAEVVVRDAECMQRSAKLCDHRISLGPERHWLSRRVRFHEAPFVEQWS